MRKCLYDRNRECAYLSEEKSGCKRKYLYNVKGKKYCVSIREKRKNLVNRVYEITQEGNFIQCKFDGLPDEIKKVLRGKVYMTNKL